MTALNELTLPRTHKACASQDIRVVRACARARGTVGGCGGVAKTGRPPKMYAYWTLSLAQMAICQTGHDTGFTVSVDDQWPKSARQKTYRKADGSVHSGILNFGASSASSAFKISLAAFSSLRRSFLACRRGNRSYHHAAIRRPYR